MDSFSRMAIIVEMALTSQLKDRLVSELVNILINKITT